MEGTNYWNRKNKDRNVAEETEPRIGVPEGRKVDAVAILTPVPCTARRPTLKDGENEA